MQYECPVIINYDIYSIFLAIRADLLPAGVATLPVAFFEILGLAGDAGAGIAVVFDCPTVSVVFLFTLELCFPCRYNAAPPITAKPTITPI